ncbi:hypothetical protein BJY52DRAFT_513890 [Lactarius psammicola]|nr:hypothetical protein BJY52DRAFT_513890 [Lactarius psammicola]
MGLMSSLTLTPRLAQCSCRDRPIFLDDYRKDCARVQCALLNVYIRLGCIWPRGQSNKHRYSDAFVGSVPLDDYRNDCTSVQYTFYTQRVHRVIRYSIQCWYRVGAAVNESPKLGCIRARGQCNEHRYSIPTPS